jgi:hypothetical protein
LPSAPFGIPGFGYNGHCAESDAERAATMAADTTTVNDRFMSASMWAGSRDGAVSQGVATRRERYGCCA